MYPSKQVKIIGSNGQISLGKEYAGQMVAIDQLEEGTWMIKTGTFVPDSEKWLHQNNNLAKLEQAIAWTTDNKPEDNFDQWIEPLES